MPTDAATDDPRAHDIVFYDGACGLCHGWVKRCLAADPAGQRFRYAPREGQTWHERLSDAQRRASPDSIAILTAEGELLFRRRAVAYLGERLSHDRSVRGWTWPMRRLPAGVGDALYVGLAKARRLISTRPEQACPVVPASMRQGLLP
jgi:predicted DCC family thiol-disulfide oxidoreductase YuxK